MPEPDRDDVADIVAEARAEMSWQETRTSKGVIFNSLQTVEAGAAQNGAAKPRRPDPPILGVWESRPLDGIGNNLANPEWASAMTIYPRVAPAAYTDGLSQEPPGPGARYISNRIFNNLDVMIYSPRGITDWMAVWGQFVDHTIVVRQGRRQTGEDGEICDIAYDNDDPLEQFPNALGVVLMNRSIAAPGTGQTCPRDQVNQHSSYIGAQTVYGDDQTRLEWLREGPADGNPEHSGARLLMRGGFLPRRDSRGDPENAPNMVFGAVNDPGHTAVAGDQRANENPMIMAVQTLFAREHNRLVSLLPEAMSEEDKFQIARAVVIAEEQYITYHEFLPAIGLILEPYTGYNPELDAGATNEFATIGYRGHAMIRGFCNVRTQASRYTQEAVDWLRQLDITVEFDDESGEAHLAIPMGFTTFFQPDLVEYVGVGPVLQGIGMRVGKNNDELMSNKIRSLTAPMSETTQAVNDLTAVDIARGRDHGLPTYNQVRIAYGLAPKTSFREITGEESEEFPADLSVDDPRSLDWVELYDVHGNPTTPEADNAVRGVRRSPLAARLKGIYGDVDKVDAFIGMVCEPHLPDCELGELQATIWRREFTTLRDGDRFWHENYPVLEVIRRAFGIDYRTTLGDVIARNTDIPRHELAKNVFFAQGTPGNDMPKAEANGSGTADASTAGADMAAAGVAAQQNGEGTSSFDPLERRPWHCGVSEI